MLLQTIFLQAPGGAFISMLFPFAILAVFYFFIIRPQINRQKDQQKFTESLKEGQDVVTASGLIGRVTKIDGNVVRLMVEEKTFVKVLRSAIIGEFKG